MTRKPRSNEIDDSANLSVDAATAQLEQSISLDQLTEAFAAMLGAGENQPGAGSAEDARQTPIEAASDACAVNPRTILEAALFVGRPDNAPLTSREVAAMIRGVGADEVDGLVQELNANYDESGCPYTIRGDATGYRLVLRDEYDGLREKFAGRIREVRLSQASIDVLSIVAYSQPVTADDVTRLRGKPSGPVLSQLVRRQLLRVERPEAKARPLSYRTTDRFLELFGLDSLADLPQQEELDRA